MNKLPKEKRDQIILVSAGTVVALATIWFLFISPENMAVDKVKRDIDKQQRQLQDMTDAINKADATAGELHDVTSQLTQAEADMASNDPNAWVYDLIRHFKENYKDVEISVNGGTSIGDVDIVPNFPYKQLKVAVGGTAFYHDLGHFIADFENAFPHIRITNLSIDPIGGNGDSNEKLSFRMEITALVKPNGPQS